jgi:hypothetical protein
MESLEEYLNRKRDEIELLRAFLNSPPSPRRPRSIKEVIEQKFHLAAALKAEHTLEDWAVTETAWAHHGRVRAGAFEFRYDYQRADLHVQGPSFYELDGSAQHTIYTASGMAAIAGLLLASARVIPNADLLAWPGSYSETLELIETHARHLRLVELKGPIRDATCFPARLTILLFDSCMPAAAYDATFKWRDPRLDLIVFDTTCFGATSGRVRRVLAWADRWRIPVVLLRSHTKLDSLGVEYGRLGSAVFVFNSHLEHAQCERLDALAGEMRAAVRLFGGAALPAHFPPYVGAPSYRRLTRRRIAAILRNSRRIARDFAVALPGSLAEARLSHGLYVTLVSNRLADEQQARDAADEMARDLSKSGLPLRHAGSFGFDFAAAEWFHHNISNCYAVRIAAADLPTAIWDQVSHAVVEWWSRRFG